MADTEKLTKAEESFFASKGEEGIPDAQPETGDVQPTDPGTGGKATETTPVDPKAARAPKDEKPGGDLNQALREERDRRRAAQKEAEEERLKFTKLQSRLDTLSELARASTQQPTQPEVQIPDINTDPVGHFRAKDAIREKELADLRAWQENQISTQNATNNVQRINYIAQTHEAEFKKTTPDYSDASNHLRNLRDAQLIAYGIADPAQRIAIIAQDATTIAANALASNRNYAQVIYDMAKASGYAKAGTPPSPPTASAQPPAAKAPTEAEKLAMINKGQQAGASIGQINGAASPPTTIETLLNMSEEDFAEATKGNKWRRLFETR